MNVSFNQTANHIHEIHINGFKAGMIMLLSDFNKKISNTKKMDWRVFFWGRYQRFQIDYSSLGIWNKPYGTDISLNDLKVKLTEWVETKADVLLPKKYFEAKGYVFAHSSNGQVYTINKEYQDNWTEFFQLGGNDYLFENVQVLKERVHALNVKEAEGLEYRKQQDPESKHHYDTMLDYDYRMVSAMFDTDYYDSIRVNEYFGVPFDDGLV